MVHEDERKMDALTKRSTEITMVNNNAKLLTEMLDHYDNQSCGSEEKQLLYELFQSCEKMQPKLFRLVFSFVYKTKTQITSGLHFDLKE